MRLARDEKLVFLHIPKTAGTTVHDVLVSQFTNAQVCPDRFATLDRMNFHEIDTFRYFSGHFTKYEVDCIPGPKFVLTFLREPKDRILSLYYFWRSTPWKIIENGKMEGPRIAKSVSLLEFLRHTGANIPASINNTITRTLLGPLRKRNMIKSGFRFEEPEQCLECALVNLQRLNFVGFQETFSADFTSLLQMLNIQAGTPSSANVTGARAGWEPVEREDITPEIIAELNRLTRLDQQLYNLALANKHKLCCPYPL